MLLFTSLFLLFVLIKNIFRSGYAASGTKALPRLRPQWPHSCFTLPPYGQHPPDHPLPPGFCGKVPKLPSLSQNVVFQGVQAAGRAIRDNITAGFSFPGFGFFAEEAEKVGRSLWSEEMDSMADAVRKAVEVYTNLNEEHEWSEQEEQN